MAALFCSVDDMLIARKSQYEIDALKMGLHKTFDMKDLGDANHILGMHIIRDKNKKLLYLSRKEYIGKVLQRFNMKGGKILSTPSSPYVKLNQKTAHSQMMRGLKWPRFLMHPRLVVSCMQCCAQDLTYAIQWE